MIRSFEPGRAEVVMSGSSTRDADLCMVRVEVLNRGLVQRAGSTSFITSKVDLRLELLRTTTTTEVSKIMEGLERGEDRWGLWGV